MVPCHQHLGCQAVGRYGLDEFDEDYLTFSSKGVDPMNIPYDRFSTLCRTRHALLFLFGKKLVLWLPLHLMDAEQLESIMRRFRNHGVEVKDVS